MRKQEEDREDEDRQDEDKPAETVREKVALKAGALWLRGLRAYCKAAGDSVEQADVLKTAGRCVKMGARCARKVYKDQYKEMEYDDEDSPENENGDEEEDDKEKAHRSSEEDAVLDAFNKVMSDLFGEKKNYGRQLTNGR